MRRLLLLRHAKSDWPAGVADHDRPLAARGIDAAPRMGAYLAREGLIPDLALVSTAVRAVRTWALASPAFGEAVPARAEPRIYDAEACRLLAILRDIPDEVRAVAMIGHNPGFEDLARLLAGHGDRYALARLIQKYPTAGLAVIDFDAARWSDMAPGAGRLDRFVTPHDIGGHEDD